MFSNARRQANVDDEVATTARDECCSSWGEYNSNLFRFKPDFKCWQSVSGKVGY
jgi:hypothetical protein